MEPALSGCVREPEWLLFEAAPFQPEETDMLIPSDAPFGFGQTVTGGGTAQETMITNRDQLVAALNALSSSTNAGPTVLTLAAADYEFDHQPKREFRIGAKNLTIRAATGQRAELRNLGLVLDLASIDNVLIQDLAFHSSGNIGPDDGILFDGTDSVTGVTNRVRISHCCFDGYKDIAIEMRSHLSLVLATIDHCHFADRHPGARPPFVDRGAIDVASVIDNGTRLSGNSAVTIAFNVFEDVWRRSPRVAQTGNFVHVFNNLLFRWGFGNDEEPKPFSTWNGMSVGNAAVAAIHANRFLPWSKKATGQDASKALAHDPDTQVNIGGQARPNRFDTPDGRQDDDSPLAPVPDRPGFPTIVNVRSRYLAQSLTPPTVTTVDQVNWATVIAQAGTPVRDSQFPVLVVPA
jgi:pectate lyase